MIAFDAASDGANALPGTGSIIWSDHLISGSNRVLLVAVGANNSGLITSVTCNGTPMTLISPEVLDSNRGASSIYGLIAPPTGFVTIVVNFTGTSFIKGRSVSYTGVRQTGLPDTANYIINQSATTSQNITLTTVLPVTWVAVFSRGSGNLTAGSGQTIRCTNNTSDTFGDTNGNYISGSNIGINQSLSANIAQVAVSFADASGVSPSASQSPSSSASASISPSISSSSSVSASASKSVSPSSSQSSSISSSISSSVSSSPSPGFEDYTRQEISILPTNDNDLTTVYTSQEKIDVSTYNGIRVVQDGALDYMIHQFKIYVGDIQDDPTILCKGQSTLPPSESTIYLQIYNRVSTLWETIDTDNSTDADTDFRLAGDISDLTDYKDIEEIISCRIWQLGI